MSSESEFKTLFQTPGPWLHSVTARLGRPDAPSQGDLAKILCQNHPSLTSDQGLKLVSAVVSHSEAVVKALNTCNKKTLGHCLGILGDSGPGMVNNTTFHAVQKGFPPILAFDMLLHAGDPESPAENSPKAPTRPSSEKGHFEVYFAHTYWQAVLKEGHVTHRKAKEVEDQPRVDLDTMKDSKREYLESLRFLNDKHIPGSTASYNVAQVVFLLEAMLTGKCILEKGDIIDIAYQSIVKREPTITQEEVRGIIRNPNTDGIPAALAVAVTSSPLFLLIDHNYAVKRHNPGLSAFYLWRARGNIHRTQTSHPLGRIERQLWKLLLCAAVDHRPEDVIPNFFSNQEVLDVINTSNESFVAGELDALKFCSDALHPLTPLDDDEVPMVMGETPQTSIIIPTVGDRPSTLGDSGPPKNVSAGGAVSSGNEHEDGSKNDRGDGLGNTAQETAGGSKQTPGQIDPEDVNKDPRAEQTYSPPVTRNRDGTIPSKPRKEAVAVPRVTGHSGAAKRAHAKHEHPVHGSDHGHVHVPGITFVKVVPPQLKESEQATLKALAKTHPVIPFAARSVEPEAMVIPLYAPGEKPGEFVTRQFTYQMFSKYSTDRKMLEDMLDSMPKRDGMPLFLHPSARDSNPDLRPSKDQSIFFVCTREEFFRLPPQTQYLIHRHRCVVMINIGADPPPPFDQSTLGRFRNPRDLCPIQDMGLDNTKKEDYLRSAPLTELLPSGNRPVLNALHHPMPDDDVLTPPGIHTFTSAERAFVHLRGHEQLPEVKLPREDLRWGLVATKLARSPTHMDILATVMTVMTGAKLIAIAVPIKESFAENHFEGDLSSRYAIENWAESQSTARTHVFRWEVILLLPNMSLFMSHGIRHFVISLEDTIAAGVHTIHAAQAEAAVQVVLHHSVTESFSTNASHDSVLWLLVRLYIFWVQNILHPDYNPELDHEHVPNIETRRGLLELLFLHSYVVLYPSLNPAAYDSAAPTRNQLGVPLAMEVERYREYEFALLCAVRLGAYLDDCFDLRYDELPQGICLDQNFCSTTWQELSELAVIHMACSLSRYRRDWLKTVSKEDRTVLGFTSVAFDQQLRRALAGYNSVLEAPLVDIENFRPSPHYDFSLKETRMVEDFDAAWASSSEFTHFLPWDADAVRGSDRYMGMQLVRVGSEKRKAASMSEDESPTKRARTSL